jgi:hypothetical protein
MSLLLSCFYNLFVAVIRTRIQKLEGGMLTVHLKQTATDAYVVNPIPEGARGSFQVKVANRVLMIHELLEPFFP